MIFIDFSFNTELVHQDNPFLFTKLATKTIEVLLLKGFNHITIVWIGSCNSYPEILLIKRKGAKIKFRSLECAGKTLYIEDMSIRPNLQFPV